MNARNSWLQVFFLSALFVGTLEASDGVIEINQSCALAAGCMPGDSAGFPITITQPGSYLLTSNLLAQAGAQPVISIVASNVTLDLNGFALLGNVSCFDTGVFPVVIVCNGNGPQYGILVDIVTGTLHSVVIRNGSILGISGVGIQISSTAGAVIEDVEISRTQGHGLVVSSAGNIIRRTHVSLSGLNGIFTGEAAMLESVVTFSNGESGIIAGNRSILENVNSRRNQGQGVQGEYDVKVVEATVYGNGGDGISINAGGTVSRASASGNGGSGIVINGSGIVESSTANDNDGDGIRCGNDCLISGNTARINTGSGVDAEGGSVLDNVLTGNLHGLRSNSLVLLFGRNNLTGSLGNTVEGFVGGGIGSLGNNLCESYLNGVITKC